ncbi:DegV family protein [Alkaliphilus transvaalensis]|uniref:DegV family protein n=1 Tax=Alkaliphilus transvaalensis TaxID=114628 RepID=UPI00047CFD55|nr:DegV family protein [Alkaliphilus transvaalensis]
MSIKVFTDSTSYIDAEVIKDLEMKVLPLSVKFEDASFKETEIDNDTFYKMMEKKGIPQSSQPALGEMCDEMQKVVEQGDELVCVLLSSEMSGTYSTAHMAKNMTLEKYPEAKIELIDSRSNCMQLGFAAIVAARIAKVGGSLKEVVDGTMENIKKSRFLFIPDNLEYLKKGGRIGKANAIIGNLLKIIPILTVEEGVTTVFKKVRTKKKAIVTMIEEMMGDIERYGLGEIVVHHINCLEEAKGVVNMIKDKLEVDVKIQDIGPVIGLHVGPGAIGIAYYTKDRMRD